MKTIENLDLKVTYRISLEDVEVPDEIYDQLEKMQDDGSCSLTFVNNNYPELYEWIIKNNSISEDNTDEVEYDVWDFN